MEVKTYLKNRLTTLIPTFEKPENPIKLIRLLNVKQTVFFLIAFAAWTLSGCGFFVVPLNVTSIAHSYGVLTTDTARSITVTLMTRCIGALLFGFAGDRFSRKWTFIANIVLYALLGVITGFCQTYTQFFVARAFYGIAMGGIYGNAAAIALEDAPIPARGLLSGLLQQGYMLGCLLASILSPLIANNQSYGWRAAFWFIGILPLVVAICHAFLPETEAYYRIKEIGQKLRQGEFLP